MTEQEIQDLALKIAQDARLGGFHLDDGTCIDAITSFFRAAVAHGLRMGADLCEEKASSYNRTDVGLPTVEYVRMKQTAYEHASAIRVKADELESAP